MIDATEGHMADLRLKRIAASVGLMAHYVMEPKDALLNAIQLKGNLTDEDRACLVSLLLQTFPADQAELVASLSFEGAGWPKPCLMPGALDDARLWADGANPNELSAYAMACFENMGKGKQRAFGKWVAGKVG